MTVLAAAGNDLARGATAAAIPGRHRRGPPESARRLETGCEPEGGPEAYVITAHDARTGKEL